MQIIPTVLEEVKRIRLTRHGDARGFFMERYRDNWRKEIGIAQPLVQINHSRSAPNVLRGIHVQHTPAQGKLVGVLQGAILDVAVDLRPDSPSFKRYVAVELSAENGELLWIPEGFGHGFAVLGNTPADVLYQTSNYYAAEGELSVRYDDADLAIDWPLPAPTLSARDDAAPSLQTVLPKLHQINLRYANAQSAARN